MPFTNNTQGSSQPNTCDPVVDRLSIRPVYRTICELFFMKGRP